MAHSLRGKDRENFIITVCDLNIYLGCICALTCEKNATVEEYIWKTLNNYFEPRKIKFYDKSSGIWKENIKKLNSNKKRQTGKERKHEQYYICNNRKL